jgi:hypothetical protein
MIVFQQQIFSFSYWIRGGPSSTIRSLALHSATMETNQSRWAALFRTLPRGETRMVSDATKAELKAGILRDLPEIADISSADLREKVTDAWALSQTR